MLPSSPPPPGVVPEGCLAPAVLEGCLVVCLAGVLGVSLVPSLAVARRELAALATRVMEALLECASLAQWIVVPHHCHLDQRRP